MAFEVFAGIVGRSKRDHCTMFHRSGKHDHIELAYPFWVVKKGSETVLIDTGFSQKMADGRGIFDYVAPTEVLGRMKIDPKDIQKIVVSHLHYDHFSAPETFPNATFYIQREDIDYFLGRGRVHPATHSSDWAAIDQLPALRTAGRLKEIDGDIDFGDSIKLVRVGGHTPGLQITVLAPPDAPPIVLACDASHFYGNLESKNPTALIHNYDEYQYGFNTIEAFSKGGQWFPGHDPKMLAHFDQVTDRVYKVKQ